MNRKEEKLLRKFVRDNLVKPIIEQQRKEERVRQWARSLISETQAVHTLETLFEAKDMANPHPNTGINNLEMLFGKESPLLRPSFNN